MPHLKRFGRNVTGLAVGTIGLGVSSSIIAGLPQSQITNFGQAGLRNIGGFFPLAGTAIGAGFALRSLRLLPAAIPKKVLRRSL